MCTAIGYRTGDFYFGRTLDNDFSYGEEIVVTPRNYPFVFRKEGRLEHHYALIGMAHIADGCPLYYEATNEKGLSVAGLNFVGNAVYAEPTDDPVSEEIASFELIPWILGQCATVSQAREHLARLRIVNIAFSEGLPPASLHWMIADQDSAITVESMADGLHVYDNPIGVLTNNPPFDSQLLGLNRYLSLSPAQPENRFSDRIPVCYYSRGMGALGLPGDLTSPSRFVRAAFVKLNSRCGQGEEESVNQFFHILGSVEQQRGCCEMGDGSYEVTLYTSCCNATRGIYYYTTYENHRISAVDLHRENLDRSEPVCYRLLSGENILYRN